MDGLANAPDWHGNHETISNSRNLYLNLLKRVLTDTVFAVEPNADDDGMEYLQGFINHYIRGRALTMVP